MQSVKAKKRSIPGATLGPVLSDRSFRSSVRRSYQSLYLVVAPINKLDCKKIMMEEGGRIQVKVPNLD